MKQSVDVALVARQQLILGLVRGRLVRIHGEMAGETPAHRFARTLILELDAPSGRFLDLLGYLAQDIIDVLRNSNKSVL